MSPSEQQRPLAFSAVRSNRSHAAESEEAETRRKKTPKKRKEKSVNCHVEYCSGIKCDNSRDKTPDLSFFRFPSVQDFQQRYKLLLLRACISNSVLSNCEDDSAAVLLNVLNVAPCPEDPPVRSDESVVESLVLNEHVEALDPKEAQGTVLLYTAGYVAYRFLRAHSCSQCEAAVLGAAEDHVPDSMVLMAVKAYRCDEYNTGRKWLHLDKQVKVILELINDQ
ncbi:hypothetical protein CAPTEDRAFT_203527 [Capitella teleta]|uniref:Uncharacterized protein n=1 Tax=Capitella teleta TaxID=283909 RepID=R7UK89_CAPTE|nr:hypothetical protein CAPTEDRAFT_203527 [Capitella teleta]|eukprot:ELU06959.1 hypothetical protein CAPTEDRAFT_203527 [Capitella teleta]